MADKITIGTFNLENLFTRFKFRGKRLAHIDHGRRRYRYEPYTPEELAGITKGGITINTKMFKRNLSETRDLTAQAVKALGADVVALQEVEDLGTLKLFNSRFLKGAGFRYQYLIDGNDPRFIDIALLSKLEVDFLEPGDEAGSGLRPLLESDQMENLVLRLPEEERWTHYYKGDRSYHQLDYILVSKSLAIKNSAVVPVIERRGQPFRVNQPGQPRRVHEFFPGVTGKLKASDHCPVAVTLEV